MRPVPGLLALLFAGCVEIRFYDAEIWVDVLYPPDSAWSLSPVNVVVGGAIQESSRVVRILPLLFRSPDPEPGYRPVRMSLWVDGEKRMEIPDTALTHRIRLPLSEGWHTLQVRAGTTASRIRHVRVLTPETMPIRFVPADDTTSFPRGQGLPTGRDTVLGVPPLRVRFSFDRESREWVIAHPRETLRIRALRGLHVREFPQGLYVIAFLRDTFQVFWLHREGITEIRFPTGVRIPVPSYEVVCDRSAAMLIHMERQGHIALIFHDRGVQDTLVPDLHHWVFLVCREGEAGVMAVPFSRRLRFPWVPYAHFWVEGGDTLLFSGGIWWRSGKTWHYLEPPEMPKLDLECLPGWRKQTIPEVYGDLTRVRFRCHASGPSFRVLGPHRIRIGGHAYTWSLHKEKGP